MLRVAAHLNRLRPDLKWKLLCFGTGPRLESLRKLSGSLGVAHRVHWAGYRSSVGDELTGLDALMLLSDAEGLPLTLIEAGWAATPVLATRVGGIPDLISDGESGVLVERKTPDARIARTLLSLLEDPARMSSLGRRLQEKVEIEFSKEAWLTKLRALYRDVSKQAELA
jgi:glycosyltransferase involved in cell wall biosynthesis